MIACFNFQSTTKKNKNKWLIVKYIYTLNWTTRTNRLPLLAMNRRSEATWLCTQRSKQGDPFSLGLVALPWIPRIRRVAFKVSAPRIAPTDTRHGVSSITVRREFRQLAWRCAISVSNLCADPSISCGPHFVSYARAADYLHRRSSGLSW